MKSTIFVKQRDQSDCGVACLLSVIRYHGGDATFESLREQSGTSIQGTSLLGLQQAAEQQGLTAEAFEVDDIEIFKTQATFPCILHVIINNQLEHYVLCTKVVANSGVSEYAIFDPGKGEELWSESKLLEHWKSRAVLVLQPEKNFEKVADTTSRKLTWVKHLLKEDAPLLTIAVIMGVIIAVLSMTTAVFSQKLIDDFLPNKKVTQLWLGIGLLAILLIAKSGLGYLRTLFLLRQSKDFNNRLMSDFYGKLLALPKLFFDTRKIGDITARINDTRRIQSVISYLIGNVVIDALVVVVSTVFVFAYSWQVGVVALLSVPFYAVLVWRFNPKIIKAQREVMQQYATTESHFVDAIGGVGAIISGNKTTFFEKVGTTIYAFFQERIFGLGSLANRYNVVNELFSSILIAVILALCSGLILTDKLKLGEMMAILSITVGLVGSIARLATMNIQLQEAKVAFERMFEFASLKPESSNITTNVSILGGVKSLHIRNLSFRFAGKRLLLENVSLSVQQGEMTVLMGEVGSGKSVLLQILQQFYNFENGEVIVNNAFSLSEINSKEWRNQLGVMPQDIKIFSGTLLDNIVLGNVAEEAERAIAFCKAYGFDTFFEQLPQSYATIVGEEGVNLSGGQKQLVALARALYQKPSLLLLDEPTAAMDKKTSSFVMGLLKKLKPQLAILMITHRLESSLEADRIYTLTNGVTEIMEEVELHKLML